MKTYEVTLALKFEIDAINTTDARGKVNDMKLHRVFKELKKDGRLPHGITYLRRETHPIMRRTE